MVGARVDITTADDGSLYAVLELDTEQDITSWTFVGYVYHEDDDKTALFALTIAKDTTNKTLTLTDDIVSTAAALVNYQDKLDGLKYNILCKPATVKYHRFFNGIYSIDKGGPLWAT